MQRYVVLLKFTDSGMREVHKSPERAAEFNALVEKAGAQVDFTLWTLGEYDGILQLRTPDEETAVALVLSLHKANKVHTQMMRAFGSDEFQAIVDKSEGLA